MFYAHCVTFVKISDIYSCGGDRTSCFFIKRTPDVFLQINIMRKGDLNVFYFDQFNKNLLLLNKNYKLLAFLLDYCIINTGWKLTLGPQPQ